jgi:hypothetical protein
MTGTTRHEITKERQFANLVKHSVDIMDIQRVVALLQKVGLTEIRGTPVELTP